MAYTTAQLVSYFTAADDGVAPTAAQTVLLNSYALQDQNGTLSDSATLYNAIQAPQIQATVDVAEASYQFFTGAGVSQAGLDFLVLPGAQSNANPNNLNSAYYAGFNQENRFINFAINLGTGSGAGAASFAATYGGMTVSQVVASAYQQIIGVSTVGAAAAAAGIAYLTSPANLAFYAAVAAQRGPAGLSAAQEALVVDAVAVAEVLNAAVVANVGIYALSLTAYTADLANGSVSPTAQNLLTYYGPGGAGNLTGVGNVIVSLTPGGDIVNGATTVNADLSPATLNGTGPTLNYNDNIQNVTNLNISDQFGQANDIIPATAILTNVKFITLNTAGNAGVGVNGGGSGSGTGTSFDVSGIAGAQMVTVNSGGVNTDTVKASTTTAVTVNHNNFGGAVQTLGGSAIIVNDNASGGADAVGSFIFPGANPTGTVTVNEFGSNAVTVSGGTAAAGSTAVNVTRYGAGAVTIGDQIISLVTPGTNVSSGNIVVTDNDTIQAAVGAISIYGGQNVTVNATPITGGNITVGTIAATGAALVSVNPTTGQQFVATGAVVINDNAINGLSTIYRTGQSFGTQAAVIVTGGTTVNVTSNTGSVQVGAPAAGVGVLFNGTVPVMAPNGTSPLVSGAVTITDTAVSSATTAANPVTGAAINGDANAKAAYTTAFNNALAGGATVANSILAGIAASAPVAVGETAVNVFGGVGSAATNAVTINALASAVTVGADNINGVPTNVAAPSGAVVVNDGVNLTGITPVNGAYDNILNGNQRNVTVLGGQVTNVTINTNQGTVTVGNVLNTPSTDASQPTAAIVVVDSAGYVNANSTTIDGVGNAALDAVTISGASGATGSVTVTASGGTVTIGTATALPFTNTTGAITVTQAAIETGGIFASTVTANGGTVDTVKTTGGSVTLGSILAPAAGAVSITDTFGGASVNADAFNVIGGAAVTINTTATSGQINVGAAPVVLNAAGTGLANASQYASGNVSITNDVVAGATTVLGTSVNVVNTLGATSVTIIGGNSAAITDENTTLATQGAGAGVAIGATTLATVALDGMSALSTVTTNAAVLGLSVFDAAAAAAGVTVTEVPAHVLNLTLGDETANITVTDATATTLNVNDATSLIGKAATSKGVVTLNDVKATTATIANTGTQSLVLSNDALLASITANNTGALTLGNLTGNGALKTITAGTASTGAITASINPQTTSFLGGGSSGNDTITITANNATLGASIGAVTAGSGSTNTLILDYNNVGSPALGQISGFQFAQVGSNTAPVIGGAFSGVYNLSGYKGVIAGGTLANTTTFASLSAGTTLAVTANTLAAAGVQRTIAYQLQTDTSNDTLGLTLGTGTTSVGVFGALASSIVLNTTQPGAATGAFSSGIENINITAAGAVSPTFTGLGNFVQIQDPATQALTVGGTGATTVTGFAGDSVKSIVVTDTSAVNVSMITSYANGGVSVSDTSAAGRLTASGSVLHQSDAITITGNYAVGDVVRDTINGTAITYTVLAADTASGVTATIDQAVATGLANNINTAAPANVALATAANGIVTINYINAVPTTDVTHGTLAFATKSVGQAAAGVYNVGGLNQTDTVAITVTGNAGISQTGDSISVTIGGNTYTTAATVLNGQNAQADATTVVNLINGAAIGITATNVSTGANTGIVKLVFNAASNTAIVDSSTYNNNPNTDGGTAALAHQNYQVDTVTAGGNWLTSDTASQTITAGVGALGLAPLASLSNAAATYNGVTTVASSTGAGGAANVLALADQAGAAPGLTITSATGALTGNTFNVISTAGQTFTDTVSASSVSNAEALAFTNASTPSKAAVAQVSTVTIGNGNGAAGSGDAAGDVYSVTINGSTFGIVAAGGETNAQIVTALITKIGTGPGGIFGAPGSDAAGGTAGGSEVLTTKNAGTAFTISTAYIPVGGGGGSESNATPTANQAASGQVDTLTVNGAYTVGDVVSVEANGQVYSYTVVTGDLASNTVLATDVAAALNGKANPGGTITATSAGNVVTITDPTGSGSPTDTATYGTPATDSVPVTSLISPVDTLTTGAGGGVLFIGSGGSWSPYLAVSATNFGGYSNGSETINLTASTGVSDTLIAKDGVVATANNIAGGITGFSPVNSLNADRILFAQAGGAQGVFTAQPKTAIANVTTAVTVSTLTNALNMANVLDTSGATAVDLANINYTAANGVITFSLVGAHFLGNIGNDYLYAAEAIVNQAVNQVAEFVYNGTTYVVASGATATLFNESASTVSGTNANNTTVLQFSGMTGPTGFATATNAANTAILANMVDLGATNAIAANVLNLMPNANAGSVANLANSTWVSGLAGSAAVVYNDTGFSVDQWTAANGASATGTTTFNNLAPASELIIAASIAGPQGNLVVTQTGAAGADSLVLNFNDAAGTVFNTISESNDWATALVMNGAGLTTINTLTDATNADTLLAITGNSALVIGAISDTALTSILAGGIGVAGQNGTFVAADTSSLVLGTAAAPLTQTALTITGALGGDTLFLSGVGDNVSIGNWASNTTGLNPQAVTGNVSIFASGASNTITLADDTQINLISANGAKDVIQVEGGTNAIGSTVVGASLAGITGALASSDTIKLLDAGTGNAGAINDFVWLGTNSLVTLGGNTALPSVGGTAADALFGTLGGGAANATIQVANDTVGGTSSSVVAGTATAAGTGLTTILTTSATTGLSTLAAGAHLNIVFNTANNTSVLGTEAESWANASATGSFVNTQAATSLANALDIAASQAVALSAQLNAGASTTVANGVLLENGNTGLLDWFQYGGNTYVVEANNHTTTAGATGALAHGALQTGDVVVELVGLVNLNTATFAGHTLAVQ